MSTDPDSVTNLAAVPAQQAILEKLRAAVTRHAIEVKDNGFLPEGSALEGYEASHKPGSWPVEKTIALANLASARDARNLPAFIAALEHSSEPMRWWGAHGCTMLGKQANRAEATLRKHLDDPSSSVQVAVAEALGRLGRLDIALPILRRNLQNDQAPWAGLQAANVLARFGNEASESLDFMRERLNGLPAEREAPSDPLQYQRRILTHSVAVLEGKAEPLVYPAF
jgi:HEAT repeat protein